jgi:hypothetical protein
LNPSTNQKNDGSFDIKNLKQNKTMLSKRGGKQIKIMEKQNELLISNLEERK